MVIIACEVCAKQVALPEVLVFFYIYSGFQIKVFIIGCNMPANSHLSAVDSNVAASRVTGQTTITIDDVITREVDSWVATTNNATDDGVAITVDSVEDGVTAIRDIPEDDHKDEFLASASSCHPKDSHNDAESEEEVED